MTDTRECDHDEFERANRDNQRMHPCPKCSSPKTVRAGNLIRKRGKVPARICTECGYRGPAEWFAGVKSE